MMSLVNDVISDFNYGVKAASDVFNGVNYGVKAATDVLSTSVVGRRISASSFKGALGGVDVNSVNRASNVTAKSASKACESTKRNNVSCASKFSRERDVPTGCCKTEEAFKAKPPCNNSKFKASLPQESSKVISRNMAKIDQICNKAVYSSTVTTRTASTIVEYDTKVMTTSEDSSKLGSKTNEVTEKIKPSAPHSSTPVSSINNDSFNIIGVKYVTDAHNSRKESQIAVVSKSDQKQNLAFAKDVIEIERLVTKDIDEDCMDVFGSQVDAQGESSENCVTFKDRASDSKLPIIDDATQEIKKSSNTTVEATYERESSVAPKELPKASQQLHSPEKVKTCYTEQTLYETREVEIALKKNTSLDELNNTQKNSVLTAGKDNGNTVDFSKKNILKSFISANIGIFSETETEHKKPKILDPIKQERVFFSYIE